MQFGRGRLDRKNHTHQLNVLSGMEGRCGITRCSLREYVHNGLCARAIRPLDGLTCQIWQLYVKRCERSYIRREKYLPSV